MRAQRAPLRLTFSPPDLHVVYAVFLAVRWKTILRGTAHLTEEKCRRLSPSDLRTTLQIYALLQSGTRKPHRAANWRRSVDDQRELVRNTGARGYRFKQAHEKARRDARGSDKPRKMTPDLVELIEEKLTQEQWSPIRSAGVWRRMASLYQSRAHLSACLERQERRGHAVSSLASQRQKIQQAQGQEFGARANPNRVDIDQRLYVAAKSRIGDWEATRLSAQSQRRCHVARRANLQIHQARQTADKNADLCAGCARVLCAR